MSKIVNISDLEFNKEVIEGSMLRPVMVVFWASWCGPCKIFSPTVDFVGKELNDEIKIVKMNIDDNQWTPPKYGVRGVPSILIIKDRNVIGKKIGAMSQVQLSEFISGLI